MACVFRGAHQCSLGSVLYELVEMQGMMAGSAPCNKVVHPIVSTKQERKRKRDRYRHIYLGEIHF